MARYVFFNLPGYGHINPSLGIVRDLIADGEEVIYYLPSEFRRLVESVGAEFRPFVWPSDIGWQGVPIVDRIATLPFMMGEQSSRIVPRLVKDLAAIEPDCLVYDSMFLWGRLAARITGISTVALRPTHVPINRAPMAGWLAKVPFGSDDPREAADRALARLARAYGLPNWSLRSLIEAEEPLIIVFMPREFQVAGDAFSKKFLFVGPCLRPPGSDEVEFSFGRKEDGRLHLYISLGTVFHDQPDFYRLCLQAFAGDEWSVVVSIGPQIDQRSLGSLPGNFLLVRHAPQLALLEWADAFISHGGLNSVMESLHFGVPLVVIPAIAEQRLTARRIRELGLGVALESAQLTPQLLRDAAWRAAQDAAIRAHLGAMQGCIRRAGGRQRAVNAIKRIARGLQPEPNFMTTAAYETN